MILKTLLNIFNKINPVEIVDFKTYYPSVSQLSLEQLKSYKYIAKQIKNSQKVDIKGNVSYLFLYLYELMAKLLSNCNPNNCIHLINSVKDLYPEFDNFVFYCDINIADIYFCIGKYDKYFNIMEKYLTGTNKSTHIANNILNAKYKLDFEVTAKELLSISNKLTKYGKENVDDIIPIMDKLINENGKYSKQTIINDIAEQELKHHKLYQLDLFCGNPLGRELNDKLLNNQLRKNYICFYANEKFLKLIEEFSRVAENIAREHKGLPKVNEGWINEVKLYYIIKNKYTDCNVIHQYRNNWLGRQSLDIFIEEYNIGIEYQGIQHYQPVEIFGGEEGYKKTVQRDKRKKRLCAENNIKLLYVNENYNLDTVLSEIDKLMQI